MTKYVTVIPYVYWPYLSDCLATLKLPRDNLVIVDNTYNNLGVSGSWNRGIDHVKAVDADWLIILSAAMRFGEPGGLDMLEQLGKNPDAHVVNFAAPNIEPQQFVRGKTMVGVEAGMFSWHCCAVSRKVIEDVGKFDANFYPSYFEDLDYDLRLNKFYGDKLDWPIVNIDAKSESVGHAVKHGGIQTPVDQLIAYFATKWGRHPSAAKLGEYEHPFDNPEKSLAFWPPANGGIWDE